MLDDYFQSVKATLYDRVSSPLWGAFSISWIAWNHKMLIVFVSSMTPDEKFSYIGTNLYADWCAYALSWGLWPLLTAAVFIGLVPALGELAYRVSRFWKVRLKEAKLHFDGKTPMPQDEVNKILINAAEEKRKLEEQIVTAVKERNKFREELDYATAETATLTNQLSAKETELDSADKRIEKLELALELNKVKSSGSGMKLREMLTNGDFELIYDAETGGSKPISFDDNGAIGEGRNGNEYRWDVEDGTLVIYTKSDELQNKFRFVQESNAFIPTDDEEVKALPNQRIIPARTV